MMTDTSKYRGSNQPSLNELERANRILRERAVRLAETITRSNVDSTFDVVVFHLGEEQYAIETRWIVEVCSSEFLCPLPCTPIHVAGLISLHGKMVSVLDLRVVLGLERSGELMKNIIILRNKTMEFALLAESIEGKMQISKLSLKSPSILFKEDESRFIRGINDAGIIVIDGDKLLGLSSLVVHEEVDYTLISDF